MSHVTEKLLAVLVLLALAGARPAAAQEFFTDGDEALPDWIEDLGYEHEYFGEWFDDDPDFNDDPDEYMERVEGGAAASGAVLAGFASGDDHCCWHRRTLTGDWHGYRNALMQHGIAYRGRITQYAFGVAGGIGVPVLPPLAQGDTFTYTGTAQHDFIIRTEQFHGPKHGTVLVTLEQLWGEFGNVSLRTGSTPPAVFNTIQPFVPDQRGEPYLTNLFYLQPLSKKLIIGAGRKKLPSVVDNDIFAGGDGTDQFLNQGFVASPAFLALLPITTFMGTAVLPQSWGRLTFGVMDPLDRSDKDLFEDLFTAGVIVNGMATVRTNFFCLPGEQHIGVIYKNSDLPNLQFSLKPPEYPEPEPPAGRRVLNDSWAVLWGMDQFFQVYGEDALGRPRGWGMFARAGIADGNPNPMRYNIQAGFGGQPSWAWERGDQFGVGWYMYQTSSEWSAPARAVFGYQNPHGVEMFYKYQVTPWLSVTPDVQYIRPTLGNLTQGRDSFVYGVRMNMKL